MPRRPIAALLALVVAPALPGGVFAGEGMWTPQQLPEIAGALRQAGLRLPAAQLADPGGDPLAAVVSIGGCTASFVSPRGLVLTNHHCAYGAIQLNSTPETNLMRDGFNAAAWDDEPSAGQNVRVLVPEAIYDATAQVAAAIAAAPDGIGRARALEGVEKRLVGDCETEAGIRCRLFEFDGGNAYRLVRSLEIRDVRLVYAPPGGVGNFGGEGDAWGWPRHTGDFVFYRAYVGPDGRPADFAEDNVPYQPRHWLRFAERPLREGEFVMAASYPNGTSRHALAAEFEQTAEWTYPALSTHYKALQALVEAESATDQEIAVMYASALGGWRSSARHYDGQLESFARLETAARKRAEEAAVLDWLREQGEAGQPALEAHAELERQAAAARATRERDLVTGQLHRLGTLGVAMTLYRNAIERTNPDAAREPGYQDRDQAVIEAGLQQMERRYHPAMDRILQRYWFRQYLALPAEQRDPAIDTWLDGQDDAAIERALDRLAGTGLGAAEERMRWLRADRDAFERSRDPAIRYAIAVTPSATRQELDRKARGGDALRNRPVFLAALAAYRQAQGQPVPPDANGSLRVTYGRVAGYTGLDGAERAAFTTLEEIPPRATGSEPFDAPQALLDAVAEGRHAGLADRRMRTVPVNFLADLDVTGGSSGAPVLDAQGRLTGLLFDMNWESVASNWVYDPERTRTMSVDQRYLRWILQEVYPAPALLEEMGL